MGKAASVYVLFCAFKMFKMIECPANCEIKSYPITGLDKPFGLQEVGTPRMSIQSAL
jgi:hypothetical protein